MAIGLEALVAEVCPPSVTALGMAPAVARAAQPQFDLMLALSQVSPVHVLEARQLHDHLIGAIVDPQNRDADVAAIETRMRQLVDGGP